MLDFFIGHARFFRKHAALFRDNDPAPQAVTVGTPRVAASLLVRRSTGARTLHLVNHNYDRAMTAQTGVAVSVELPACPHRVTLVSPDFAGPKKPAWTCRDGALTVRVDRLDFYDIIALG